MRDHNLANREVVDEVGQHLEFVGQLVHHLSGGLLGLEPGEAPLVHCEIVRTQTRGGKVVKGLLVYYALHYPFVLGADFLEEVHPGFFIH